MSKQAKFNAFTLALATLALAAAPPAYETKLKGRDHEKLGKLIGEYFEAKKESTGLSESMEEIGDAIAKLEKKSKGTAVLSMVEDVEAAVYFARKYKDSVPKGKMNETAYERGSASYPYAVHAPKTYKASKGPFPVVLCLPDKGESPKEHLDTNWMSPELRAEYIIAACEMPSDADKWADLDDLRVSGIGRALIMLRALRETYAIDVDRIFIAGKGASIDAAMRTAQVFPHVIAGVVGRAGDLGEVPVDNFRNLPTMFAGAGAGATAFAEGAKAAGHENVTIQADATEADILGWLKQHVRDPHPTEINFAPASLQGGNAYWIEANGFDPAEGPRVTARIDRDANTIHVEAENVSGLYISFNDVLVDMDAPIKVLVNGAETELELPRRLQFALDMAYDSGDAGRVYTNRHVFDVPASTEE